MPAIAVIYYVGTGLNSDASDGTPDNTTVRTLGVGLKQGEGYFAYYTNSGYGCPGAGMPIPANQCAYNNGVFSGDKNGSDNFEMMRAYLDNNDVADDPDNYPAFHFARNYSVTAGNLGQAYNSGWYIPSVAELYALLQLRDTLNPMLTLCGDDDSTLNLWGRYWSSTSPDYWDVTVRYGVSVTWDGSSLGCDYSDFLDDLRSHSLCAIREF